MKKEVAAAIERANVKRTKLLSGLSPDDRISLLEELFRDIYVGQHLTLQKWAALTGQSAQIDTGYIAQFVSSIAMGIPGQGFRGKGDDLIDGSEVKSAANISGVDRPRWNHNLGTIAQDRERRKKDQPTTWEQYLECPTIFYLLVDRVVSDSDEDGHPIRIRTWCLDAQEDKAWRDLILRFAATRTASQYNLQLHPPVGYDDNIVVNTIGNLDMTEVLQFDVRVDLSAENAEKAISWKKRPDFPLLPVRGRTKALPYVANVRPSRLTGSVDLVADLATLPALFPGILSRAEEATVKDSASHESEAESPE